MDIVDAKPAEDIKDLPKEEITQAETSVENVEVVESKPVRPEYDRFVKMVQVGVPLQAVKLKVSLEGLDPNVLDEILSK